MHGGGFRKRGRMIPARRATSRRAGRFGSAKSSHGAAARGR
ncbi:hypothetical protein LF41_772 [Lysobacter dokdonensis DS-58]|uniref:Uncharacterized protein n=1 Tax=Lysobacter dokdonensis DS-58 TaxID=1300345 RepID=A0A0A2WJ92_9GAMM|nr:hypothetical protein LF41_772 [Lysobacter dokdonensis DS-58]